MNNRQIMKHTNKLAREWLFAHGFDYIYFKPHRDFRKRTNQEVYFTKQGVFYQTDFYNLFDGFCYDRDGVFTWIQTSTTNYHKSDPYVEFLRGKKGFNILFIKAVKKNNRWQIRTKYITNNLTDSLKKTNKNTDNLESQKQGNEYMPVPYMSDKPNQPNI